MIALIIMFLLVFTLLFHNVRKRRPFPPGPFPLPFLGNLLSIAKSPPGYEPFLRWREKYGPVYTVWFGEDPMVVIADFAAMKQSLLAFGDVFAGRHYSRALFQCFTANNGELHGMIRTEGEQWRELRRFSMRALRDLGMGRNQVLRRVNELIGVVKMKIDSSLLEETIVDLEPLLDLMSGAIVSELMFGHGFDDSENCSDDFRSLKRSMHRVQAVQGSTRGQLLESMPWLRHLPGSTFSRAFAEFDAAVSELYAFFQVQIKRRQKLLSKKTKEDEENVEKCFVDTFLREMKRRNEETKDSEKPELGYYNLSELLGLCFDIFFAGQETSSNTIAFLLLYLLLDQRSQEHVHDELEALEKLPDERITTADRPRLPFLGAVINETQRLCNLLPINLSHKTTTPVEIGGYQLSAGTPILPQISCVMFNEQTFPDAQQFNPERFLDPAKKSLMKVEELIPFGIGKRQCAGESLARTELFIFAANFFYEFKVYPKDPLHPPSIEKRTLLTVTPEKYYCRILRRHKC